MFKIKDSRRSAASHNSHAVQMSSCLQRGSFFDFHHSSSNRPNSFHLTEDPFLLCLSAVPFISFIFLSAANLFLKYFGASLPSLHLHHCVACVYECVCACVAETICSTNELQKTAEGWKPSSVHTGFVEVKRVSSFMFHCVHIAGTPTVAVCV